MKKQDLKQAVKTLTKARGILEHENAWTKGVWGANSRNSAVDEVKDATCFCAIGAIKKAAKMTNFYDFSPREVYRAAEALAEVMDASVPDSNDHKATTHIQVLNAFDLAILQAKDKLKEMK